MIWILIKLLILLLFIMCLVVASILVLVILTLWGKYKDKKISHPLIGKVGIVIKEVSNNEFRGVVKVDEFNYSARSYDGIKLPVGLPIVIMGMEGEKLLCQPLNY